LDAHLQLITHQGKKIVFVNLSGCSTATVEKVVRSLPEYVTAQPRGSVLILADFTGALFDQEALRAMKEAAVFDKPFIKKTAWIGSDNFPEEFLGEMKKYSKREFPAFNTRQEALEWLVKE
jgi:hypothetical protein